MNQPSNGYAATQSSYTNSQNLYGSPQGLYSQAPQHYTNYVPPSNIQSTVYQPQTFSVGGNGQTPYAQAGDYSRYQTYSQLYNQGQSQLQTAPYQNYQSLGNSVPQSYTSYSTSTLTAPVSKGYNSYGNYYGNYETTTAVNDVDQRNLQRYSQYLEILQKHYGIRLPDENSNQQTQNAYTSTGQYTVTAGTAQNIYGQPKTSVNIYGQSVIQPTLSRPSTNSVVAQRIVQPQSVIQPRPVVQNIIQPYVDSRETDSSKYVNQAPYLPKQGIIGNVYGAGNTNSAVNQPNVSSNVNEREGGEYEHNVVSASTQPPTPRTFLYTTQAPLSQLMNSVQTKGDSQPMTTIAALTQQIRRLPAVLYVDSNNPESKRSEALLRETYGLPLVAFYVDKLDDSATVERLLHQLTAHKGLPYLFICGTFIGSQQHIDNYHKNGQVPQLVEYVCGDEQKKRKKKTSS